VTRGAPSPAQSIKSDSSTVPDSPYSMYQTVMPGQTYLGAPDSSPEAPNLSDPIGTMRGRKSPRDVSGVMSK
jgi:hypothetical protein